MIEKEYADILPTYQLYCTLKRKYELNEITKEAVIVAMRSLCVEIGEFLQIIYSNTNMEEERKELKSMLTNLNFK